MNTELTLLIGVFIIMMAVWEVVSGRTRDGRKTPQDWQMGFIASAMMVAVQRPLVLLAITLILGVMWPASAGSLGWLEESYFLPTLIAFFCIEELLHASAHYFSHARRPKQKWLQRVQQFYKQNHRPHHLSGGPDNRGQISVTQSFVNGWAWWLILPNYWFQLLGLYLGLVEVFVVATLIKGLWAAHTHVNWNYDLYFHNHRWPWVRQAMWGLSHVLTFPTQHHHHHSRGPNSAKNLSSTLAIYDWLIFDTLAIETSKPDTYGWRQKPEEAESVWHRYFNGLEQKFINAVQVGRKLVD